MTVADATRHTGLTAARKAVRHGPTARTIDRNATGSTFSKALATHVRTLDVPGGKGRHR